MPEIELPIVTICATIELIDDSIVEDDEQLLLAVTAGSFVFRAVITILDTLDSKCSHTATYAHRML